MMYRKPRFLELLHEIREEMSRESDYDMELFAQKLVDGLKPADKAPIARPAASATARRHSTKPKARARRKL